MKISTILERTYQAFASAFGISAAPENKRMYISLPGLQLTVQYASNENKYDGLSMEELNDRLILVDYQLALLEDLNPDEDLFDGAPRHHRAEELEEQFDEILAAMERLERSAKDFRRYCVCS